MPEVGVPLPSITATNSFDPDPHCRDRFTVHYTPTHGSWLNQAEIEIGLFSRQCLGKRRIPSLKILKAEARAWNCRMNRDRVKIDWKFDRRAARRKFGYKCQSFTRSMT
jgi:hypothetical protein